MDRPEIHFKDSLLSVYIHIRMSRVIVIYDFEMLLTCAFKWKFNLTFFKLIWYSKNTLFFFTDQSAAR